MIESIDPSREPDEEEDWAWKESMAESIAYLKQVLDSNPPALPAD